MTWPVRGKSADRWGKSNFPVPIKKFTWPVFCAHIPVRCSGVEVLERCFFSKINIARAVINNAGVLDIMLCTLGVISYRKS